MPNSCSLTFPVCSGCLRGEEALDFWDEPTEAQTMLIHIRCSQKQCIRYIFVLLHWDCNGVYFLTLGKVYILLENPDELLLKDSAFQAKPFFFQLIIIVIFLQALNIFMYTEVDEMELYMSFDLFSPEYCAVAIPYLKPSKAWLFTTGINFAG